MATIIGLNVGGHNYTTSRSTLTRYPASMLGTMFSDRLPSAKDEQGNFVIDRDGDIFRHILNFLRTSELVVPDGFKEFDMLAKEADFYQIQELNKAISDAKRRRVVKIEIRDYEQRSRAYTSNLHTRHFGTFTDWSIYGSYDTLLAINQSTIYGKRVTEFSKLYPDKNLLHISWYDKSSVPTYGVAFPTKMLEKPHNVDNGTISTEVTERIFFELYLQGYKRDDKFDMVDSVQDIDARFTNVRLKSAKTYMFFK